MSQETALRKAQKQVFTLLKNKVEWNKAISVACKHHPDVGRRELILACRPKRG